MIRFGFVWTYISRGIPLSSPIQSGEPFGEETTQEIIDRFHRDGFVHIPGVLEAGEMQALRDRTDALLDDPLLAEEEDPGLHDRRYVQMHGEGDRPFILRNTIALDGIFREMLIREPILSLAEAIVGPNCRFCGQNVLRNQSGVAIERWHVDGAVHFPVPEGVPRHNPQIRPPVLWITVQMALSDIERIEHGPHAVRPRKPPFGQGAEQSGESGIRGARPCIRFLQGGGHLRAGSAVLAPGRAEQV